MKDHTFHEIWDKWAVDWFMHQTIDFNGKNIPVSSVCKLKDGYSDVTCKRYLKIKEIIKGAYFKEKGKLVSRYKRAAIIAYAINESSPLIYDASFDKKDIDACFLKQRLAFHVAIGSIIQDYPEDQVADIADKKDLFDFKRLGMADVADGEDDFLTSVYKDMFFAAAYENYNVLTMANVFGLLTEKASELGNLTPLASSEE